MRRKNRKIAKFEAAERKADLEAEVRELREFNERFLGERARFDKIIEAIYAEHSPRTFHPRDGVGLELRCRRCQTDEHHTWASHNYVPWPCPTVASFAAYAVYVPVDDPDKSPSDDSSRDE